MRTWLRTALVGLLWRLARVELPRGRLVWAGRARITDGSDSSEHRRALVAIFEDTAGLERAVNSGMMGLEDGDDSVAVVVKR